MDIPASRRRAEGGLGIHCSGGAEEAEEAEEAEGKKKRKKEALSMHCSGG